METKELQPRTVASKRVSDLIHELADAIASEQRTVSLSLAGNTFTVHMENTSINITICEKGGQE